MCHPKQDPPTNLDEKDPDRRAFFESALKHMEELDEQAGDWRIHLPYGALLRYSDDSAVREQYKDHFNRCAFCQEAMKTMNPGGGNPNGPGLVSGDVHCTHYQPFTAGTSWSSRHIVERKVLVGSALC